MPFFRRSQPAAVDDDGPMTLEEFALRAVPGREPLVLHAGLDIGKLSDPTALVLYSLERGRRTMREARRLPLGTRYDDTADRLAHWALATARATSSLTIFMDCNGVGEGVHERLSRRLSGGQVLLVPVLTTGGAEGPHRVSQERGKRADPRVHVAKNWLVEALEGGINTGRIRAAAGCPDLAEVQRQLNAFRATWSEGRHVGYEAKSGDHDDLVMASALPLVHELPPEGEDVSGLGLLSAKFVPPELDDEFYPASRVESWREGW